MSDADARIAALRARIDALDADLVRALDERARVASEIGRIKQGGGGGFYAPAREQEVLDRAHAASSGDFPRPALDVVLREVMSASRALVAPTRVAYLGVPGGLTHVAARLRFGTSSTFGGEPSAAALLDAIASGRADYGVVPWGGPDTPGFDVVDLLIDSPVCLFGEFRAERGHCLLARPGGGEVRTVYAHPGAMALCERWFAARPASTQFVPVASGVVAMQCAATGAGGAALVPDGLAEDDALTVIERGLDDAVPRRRYLLLSLHEPAPSANDTTVLLLVLRQAPGTLSDVLARFSAAGRSVAWVEMRPTHRRAWEHVFLLAVRGHQADPSMVAVLGAVSGAAEFARVLGSFPTE